MIGVLLLILAAGLIVTQVRVEYCPECERDWSTRVRPVTRVDRGDGSIEYSRCIRSSIDWNHCTECSGTSRVSLWKAWSLRRR
ncbi:MAG: hypothetical protein HY293_23240 [Planctomycetes bacterium]|nr:hypothetical protein [Planctomycetota bacterium]